MIVLLRPRRAKQPTSSTIFTSLSLQNPHQTSNPFGGGRPYLLPYSFTASLSVLLCLQPKHSNQLFEPNQTKPNQTRANHTPSKEDQDERRSFVPCPLSLVVELGTNSPREKIIPLLQPSLNQHLNRMSLLQGLQLHPILPTQLPFFLLREFMQTIPTFHQTSLIKYQSSFDRGIRL